MKYGLHLIAIFSFIGMLGIQESALSILFFISYGLWFLSTRFFLPLPGRDGNFPNLSIIIVGPFILWTVSAAVSALIALIPEISGNPAPWMHSELIQSPSRERLALSWLVRYAAPSISAVLSVVLISVLSRETRGDWARNWTRVMALVPLAAFLKVLQGVVESMGNPLLDPRHAMPYPGPNPVSAMLLCGMAHCSIYLHMKFSDLRLSFVEDSISSVHAAASSVTLIGRVLRIHWPHLLLMILYGVALIPAGSRSSLPVLAIWAVIAILRLSGPGAPHDSSGFSVKVFFVLLPLILISASGHGTLMNSFSAGSVSGSERIFGALMSPCQCSGVHDLNCPGGKSIFATGQRVIPWSGRLWVSGASSEISQATEIIRVSGKSDIFMDINFPQCVSLVGMSYSMKTATARNRVLIESDGLTVGDFHGCSGMGQGGLVSLNFPLTETTRLKVEFSPPYRTDIFEIRNLSFFRSIAPTSGISPTHSTESAGGENLVSVQGMDRPEYGCMDWILGRFRANLIRVSLHLWPFIPVTGTGPGTAGIVLNRGSDLFETEGMISPRHAHNMVLQSFLEAGWAGGISSLLIMVIIGLAWIRSMVCPFFECGIILSVFLVFNGVDCIICSPALACYLVFSVAMALRISEE
ncbi:MAG: hypothetical protein CVV64_01840 [Candidatus Wallbacteria bacterium HGW-Wallbacteria-1]|jgi:hypothetical protein|uniref:O-antigen ligase domain-containing protein n=1 Tax=Candidatus Wallbacteria bacterium HGW-Wallbacteria-1 TaxID=2013854 RepID=A0A2N1PV07_9BACT|nr:MAG: hypothetical protein CVV64_01840 [Candidatus Wallbacteria bacterium HGW-Wallbacteria-1]